MVVDIFPEDDAGFIARCQHHAAWCWRSATLTDDDLAKMRTSLKRHVSKHLTVDVFYHNCLPQIPGLAQTKAAFDAMRA